MSPELSARTRPGGDLVALADWLADEFTTRTPAPERLRVARDHGFLAAPIPIELGGLGVDSVHDLVVAAGRLARGDASVAGAISTHVAVVHAIERRRQVALAAGDARRERALAARLEAIARDGVLMAATGDHEQDGHSGLFNAAASLGAAEAAFARVAAHERVAEAAAADLAAARGALARAAARVDDHQREAA